MNLGYTWFWILISHSHAWRSQLMGPYTDVVAAAVSSPEVQQAVVNTTHAFLTNGLNTIPFGTKYYVEGPNAGQWIANRARSTVGSHFALLARQGTWGSAF
jgi:hypothetical protein